MSRRWFEQLGRGLFFGLAFVVIAAPAALAQTSTGSIRGYVTDASGAPVAGARDRKSTRLNSSHLVISYAVFCLKKKKNRDCNGDLVYAGTADVLLPRQPHYPHRVT